MAEAAAGEAHPIVLFDSSDYDSDGDTHPSKKEVTRKRKRTVVSPMMAGIFAALHPSVEAVKNQLQMWNSQCVPRIRGSGGKHLRFTCKNERAGCPLNVSCVKVNSGLSFKMSPATYRPGNCSELKTKAQSAQSVQSHAQSVQSHAQSVQSVQSLQSHAHIAESPELECCLCSLSLLSSSKFTRCDNDHVFCAGCFNNMVRNQVTNVGKVRFVASKTVYCVVCNPQIAICMRDAAQHLTTQVWNQYLTAMSEADVVAEQQRFESILKNAQNTHLSPLDEAMILVRTKISPQCPKCLKPIPDFDACASIVCGRVHGVQGPIQPALGCGALLCGWCMRVCSMYDHSSHVADCIHNPRPGHIFPESRQAWRNVQNFLARQRVYKFVATLPKGLAGEVLRKVALEFPEIKSTESLESGTSVTSLQQRNDSSDRNLRPNPPIRQPSFLANVDQLVSMNIANRARAEQVLESVQNDLQAAIDLLLAAA
jgi:hypothetical protein